MRGPPERVVHPTLEALIQDAAERIAGALEGAVAERGRAFVVLTGGSTVPPLYRTLAQPACAARVDWPRIHVFWSDERGVPPDHPESNYGMARESLLARVPVRREHVHRMRGEEPDRERAAAEAEAELRAAMELAGDEVPRFDLVLLGLGADAHVASLFPGSPLLGERERLVAAVRAELFPVPDPEVDRLTLTPPALNGSREVLWLVSGERKAPAVRTALAGPRDPRAVPAQVVQPTEGSVTWLLDADAAAGLM